MDAKILVIELPRDDADTVLLILKEKFGFTADPKIMTRLTREDGSNAHHFEWQINQ